MNMKRFLPALFFLFVLSELRAQDLQHAQFFALPVLMNPAFAGNLEFDCRELKSSARAAVLSRRQWGVFNSDALCLELFRKKSQLGLALQVQSQRQAGNRLSSNSAGLALSHRLGLGETWHLASGIQMSLVQRGFAFQQLKYTGQFNDQGFTGIQTADNLSPADPGKFFADFSAGAIAFSRLFWSGISVQHANRPLLSDFSEERLPLKISLHAGYKIEFRPEPNFGLFRRDISLHPVWQLRMQKPFSQMDAGFYYNHEPFMAGVLYRGFAIIRKDAAQRISQDAVVLLAGIKKDGFKLGYSTELNLRRKSASIALTHELSLSYQYARKGCARRRYGKWISIPSF